MTRVVTFTDECNGVQPAAVLTVILQMHPCVESIEQACGDDIVDLRCALKRAVIIVVFKAVGKSENVQLNARRSAVVSALCHILEIVAVFDRGFTENIADNTAGNAGLTAGTKRCAVGNTVFDGRIFDSAGYAAGFRLCLQADICPAVCDGGIFRSADNAAAVKLTDNAADNTEIFDCSALCSAEQTYIVATLIVYIKTVYSVAAAVKSAFENIGK